MVGYRHMKSMNVTNYMSNNGSVYRVKDIGEAAAQLCNSSKLLGLEKDTDFFWFVFSNENNACDEISNKYWFGDLLINAKTFHESLRKLRDVLFAQKDGRE